MNRRLQKGIRVSKPSKARKPLLRRTALAGLAHSGASEGTGAPSPGLALGARTPSLRLLAALALALAATLALTAAPALASTTYTQIGEITGPEAGVTFGSLKSESVAVNDHNGHVYVADSATHRVYDFASPSATTAEAVWDGTTTPAGEWTGNLAVAVDNASGDVYVADSTNKVIDKFDQDGNLIESFGDTEVLGSPAPSGQLAGLKTVAGFFAPAEAGSFGIAVDQATHDLYAIDAGNRAIDVFDETGAYLEAPSKALAEGLPAAEAQTLFACGGAYADGIAVNDNSGELLLSDSCEVKAFRFALSDGSFIAAIDGSETPTGIFGGYTSLAADNGSGRIYVNDTAHELVDAFKPNATYTNSQITGTPTGSFGGLAVDQANHDVYVADSGAGAVKLFEVHTSPPGPSIDSTSALAVTATSATLQAELNPEGLPTTYHFEYDTAPYAEGGGLHGESTPTASAGSGTADVTRSAQLQGLVPATTYHYRLVATNALGTVEGPDRSFTTQGPAGPPLPDGRGWEMVSPPAKRGIPLDAIGLGDIQAAADGSGLAYVAHGSINAEAPGNPSPAFSELLSRRGPAGWSTRDITTPNEAPAGGLIGGGSEYRLFSPDLSLGAVEPSGATPLSPRAGERTPYLRQPDGSFTPLVTEANVPLGTEFGGGRGVEFLDGTPDLAHLILTSVQALTADFSPSFIPEPSVANLYEWSSGQLSLVSQVPDPSGSATACGGSGPACLPAAEAGLDSVLGEGFMNRHALSADGSRAVFAATASSGVEHHLFLRDAQRGETLQLDANQGGEGGQSKPQFQDASADGSRVFFKDVARLTADSTADPLGTEADLYMCQIEVDGEGHLDCALTDLSANTLNPAEPADVHGLVLAAAADGSAIYFVANGALAPGAVSGNCNGGGGGECNLYRYDTETSSLSFLAVLSGADAPDWGGKGAPDLTRLTSRVSPDGRWLAFMSQRPLTGYDNRDAATGARDEEVFLYDSQTPALHCASCNPTGARPRGLFDGKGPLVDHQEAWNGTSLAASIPAWTNTSLTTTLYQSRYLSDSGRLFFNAADALVPQDSNGTEDVYQYEPPGVGGCTEQSPTYSPKSQGCVDLISSGTSAEESAFLDASESGNDVFFLTAAQLSPSDHDTALDAYDAHVCSAELPCPPPPAPAEPECAGDACQPPAVPPNDATPGSLTFHGAGNLTECPKGKVKRSGKCVARKHKKAHKKHGKKSHRRTAGHNRGGAK
jgi:hypothetical protein